MGSHLRIHSLKNFHRVNYKPGVYLGWKEIGRKTGDGGKVTHKLHEVPGQMYSIFATPYS